LSSTWIQYQLYGLNWLEDLSASFLGEFVLFYYRNEITWEDIGMTIGQILTDNSRGAPIRFSSLLTTARTLRAILIAQVLFGESREWRLCA
jgi:hypothetical protein